MNDAAPKHAFATLAAAGVLFLLFCGELRWSEAAGPWAPPAVAVCGLALAAGRGAIGGAALAVWAGLLHTAATAGSPGVAVVTIAVFAAGLRTMQAETGRRWALAGPLGWVAAAALTATADTLGGGAAEVAWRSLPLAIVVGLVGGGLASAFGGGRIAERGWM